MKNVKIIDVLTFAMVLIASAASSSLYSQQIELKTENVQLAPTISESDAAIVYASIESHLVRYAQFGTLLDKEENEVTQNSHGSYIKLFTNTTAMVVKDYEYSPVDRQKADEYALIVYNNLRQAGVEFVIEEAKVIELTPVGSGTYYRAIVEVTKRRFNYLDANGNEQKFAGGNLMKEKFYYDIRNDDLSNPSIGEIKLNSKQKLADQNNQIIALSFGVGSSSHNFSDSNLSNIAGSGELTSKAGLNYSFGLDFQTDKWINSKSNPNKVIGLSVGLRYSSIGLNTELSDYSLSPFTQVLSRNGDSQTYDRWVGPVSAQEDLRIGVLQVPLGISYELNAKQKSAFFVSLRLIPTFGLSAKGELTGEGYYEAQLWDEDEETEWEGASQYFVGNIKNPNSSDPNELVTNGALDPYQTGLRNLKFDSSPTLQPFSLGIEVSPALYLNFSDGDPSWGVMFALDLGYHFNSLIELNPGDSVDDMPFKFSNDYNQQGLPSNFISSSSAFTYGIRVGIFQRLISSPS